MWLVEQHFARNISVMPAPLLLLAAIAERTQRLRLGTAIVQLPLSHPVRVAEELAVLDVLSGGRAELGVGRGSNPAHYGGFGVPMQDTRERMEESVALIERLWRHERSSFTGQFYQVEELALAPRPLQNPPPIRVAANSLDTAIWAGQSGYPVIFAANINPFAKLPQLLAAYRAERSRGGFANDDPDDVSVLMPLCVGESRAQVQRELEPSVLHYARLVSALAAAALPKQPTEQARRELEPIIERMRRIDFQQLEDTFGVVGTPEVCVARLRALQQQLGHGRVIGWFNFDGLVEHAAVMRSMERFARDVLPHVA